MHRRHMPAQMRHPLVRVAAVALVRSRLGVDAQVAVQRAARLERLLALGAREALLGGVHVQLVVLERAESVEGGGALVAHVAARQLLVRGDVAAQVGRAGVGVVAVRTAADGAVLAVRAAQVFAERVVGAELGAAVLADEQRGAGAERAAQVPVQLHGRLEHRLTARALQGRCRRRGVGRGGGVTQRQLFI